MRRTSVFSAALLLTCFFCGWASAQPPPQQIPPRPTEAERQRIEALKHQLEQLRSQTDDRAKPEAPAATRDADYDKWASAYTQGAYAWHQTSTIIIFWVVMLVVLSGIALATWQLQTWIKRVKTYDEVFLERLRKGKAADTEAIKTVGAAPGSEFTMKSDTLTLSSPYVGVVILGLSMGFFLAYLLLVYPILQGP